MAIKVGNQTVIDDSRNWAGDKISNVEYGRSQTYQTISPSNLITGLQYGYLESYDQVALNSTGALAIYNESSGGNQKCTYIDTTSNTITYPITTSISPSGWDPGLGTGYGNLVALDSTRALLFSRVTSGGLFARIITATASSISTTAAVRVDNSLETIQSFQGAILLDTDKVLVQYIKYVPGDGTYHLVCRIITTSGSLTVNSEFTVYAQGTTYIEQASITALSTTKAISVYEDRANSVKATAVVLDINGLTITKGSPHAFAERTSSKIRGSSNLYVNNVHAINSTSALVIYAENNYYMTACIVATSGTTITSSSTKLSFGSGASNNYFSSVNRSTNNYAISYVAANRLDIDQSTFAQVLSLYTDGNSISVGALYDTRDTLTYSNMSKLSNNVVLYARYYSVNITPVLLDLLVFEKLTLTSSSPQYIKVTKDNVYDEITLPSISGITNGFGRFVIENAGDSNIIVGDSVNYTQVEPQDILTCSIINGKWSFITLERRKDCVLFPASVLEDNGVDMQSQLMSCKLTSTTAIAVYSLSTTIKAKVITTTTSNDVNYGTSYNVSGATGYVYGVERIDSSRVIVIYKIPQGNLAVVVLSISGTVVTSGSPLSLTSNAAVGIPNISMFDGTYALVNYVTSIDSQDQSCFRCLSISGTSISAGTELSLNDNYSNGNYTYSCVAVNSTRALYVATTSGGTYCYLIAKTAGSTSISNISSAKLYMASNDWIQNRAMTRLDNSRVFAIASAISPSYGIVFTISNDQISYGPKTMIINRACTWFSVKAVDANTVMMSTMVSASGLAEASAEVFTLMVYGNTVKVGKGSKFGGNQSYSDVTPLTNDTAIITYQTEGIFNPGQPSLIRRGYGRVISIKDAI